MDRSGSGPRRPGAAHVIGSHGALAACSAAGAALIAAGVYAWRVLALDPGVVVAFGGALLVAVALWSLRDTGKRWILEDDELVLESPGGTTRRRIADLVGVQRGLAGAHVLTFTDGHFETLSLLVRDTTLLSRLRAIVESRGPGSAPIVRPEGDAPWIALSDLRFPDRCVACEAAATTDVTMRAERSVDVIAMFQVAEARVHVPVCSTHAAKRWLPWAAAVTVPAVLVGVTVAIDGVVPQSTQIWPMIGALASAGIGLVVVSLRGAWWMLGIRLGRLAPDLVHARLYVRDPELRREIVELTIGHRRAEALARAVIDG